MDRDLIIGKILARGTEGDDVDVKLLLFARWIINIYGTPKYTGNVDDKEWWKSKLIHFKNEVYPTMVLNGSVDNTKDFLEING
jgi:hypothetical protein